MTQARTEATIIRNCIREGRPLPKVIEDAPDIDDAHLFYYLAFDDLTTCRLYENGPIPYMYINDYCAQYGLDEDQTSDIRYVITNVDGWLRERWAEELNQKSKRKK